MTNPWKTFVIWAAIVLGCGMWLKHCDNRVPDYGCVEQVTPWGVECG